MAVGILLAVVFFVTTHCELNDALSWLSRDTACGELSGEFAALPASAIFHGVSCLVTWNVARSGIWLLALL